MQLVAGFKIIHMRIIDRLLAYLQSSKISPYTFERTCSIANGYLRKQEKGKGSIGSVIIDKIHRHYPELDMYWLMTGEGVMIRPEPASMKVEEQSFSYLSKDMLKSLTEKIGLLEASLADKEKIIAMLERELKDSRVAEASTIMRSSNL